MDLEQLIRFVDWDKAPLAGFVLLVAVIVQIFAGRFLDQLGEQFTDRRLLFKKLKALLRFAIYLVVTILVGSSLLQLESSALLALLGTIGVAIGFAFQDLLASLMAGVILLLDEPFQVGDRIAFGGFYGEVQEIGIRSVRLVTLDDNLVTIPNNKFLSEAVASANAGALDCMVVIPFYIAAGEDFARARQLIAEAAATSRYVFLQKPLTTLIADEFMGERFVTVVRVKAYVFDARYEKAFVSDVTERVKVALRAEGIRGPDEQYRDVELNWGRERPRG